MPVVPLPLRPEDGEVRLDLQGLLNELYEQLGYGYFIDYDQSPPSPWSLTEI
ncbi:MAG: DUF4058 family protein [Cyanobacteria bacterium P01_A01_bin.123]